MHDAHVYDCVEGCTIVYIHVLYNVGRAPHSASGTAHIAHTSHRTPHSAHRARIIYYVTLNCMTSVTLAATVAVTPPFIQYQIT